MKCATCGDEITDKAVRTSKIMIRISGLTPEARGTISALWKIRHDSPMNRKMLRAAVHSEQKWRRMFQRLPRQSGK